MGYLGVRGLIPAQCNSETHQWGLTQQFAAADQVPDGDVEISVTAAPVGDFSERMSDEDVLQGAVLQTASS